MDIFDAAIKREEEGSLYYLDLSGKATAQGIKTIFSTMADEEKKHGEIIARLKAGDGAFDAHESNISDLLRAFLKNTKDAVKAFNYDIANIPLYRKAQEMEMQERNFYNDLVEKADEHTRQALLYLAGEEVKHYDYLERLVHALRRPPQWGTDMGLGLMDF